MIALEISVNGERVCLAGASGSVYCTTFWGRFTPPEGQFVLRIGGREYGQGVGKAGDSHEWPPHFINLGDEVTLRFVESESVDPPSPPRAAGG